MNDRKCLLIIRGKVSTDNPFFKQKQACIHLKMLYMSLEWYRIE